MSSSYTKAKQYAKQVRDAHLSQDIDDDTDESRAYVHTRLSRLTRFHERCLQYRAEHDRRDERSLQKVEGRRRGVREYMVMRAVDEATDLDLHALYELYAACVSSVLIACVDVFESYQTSASASSGLDLQDMMQDSYAHYLTALVTYDWQKEGDRLGLGLGHWVTLTARERYVSSVTKHQNTVEAQALSLYDQDDEGREVEREIAGGLDAVDVGGGVEHEQIARLLAGTDDRLQTLIDRLFEDVPASGAK